MNRSVILVFMEYFTNIVYIMNAFQKKKVFFLTVQQHTKQNKNNKTVLGLLEALQSLSF